MSQENMFDEQWLDITVRKQKYQEQWTGDIEHPLSTRMKKKHKHIRDNIISDSAIDLQSLSRNISSSDKRTSNTSPSMFLNAKAEKERKKKKKKKQKQQNKQREMVQVVLSENLLEIDSKNSNLMAELLKCHRSLLIWKQELYIYQSDHGCFKKTSRREVARDLRSLLAFEEQLKISARQYQEAFDQLLISDDLEIEEGFFENRPLVNCLNGVVDVMSKNLLEHSPEYRFKHCVNANYRPEAGKCERFLEYLDYITRGDKELQRLLRVMMGYIFSHYNNAKKAFLLYGIPHTGKSVLCALLERIIGADATCHVDLAMLSRQEYAATLNSKLLNVAPDLKNEALKDVGFFKSLVSHDDTISARLLYTNPMDLKCETKMLFSTNHLLTFDTSLDMNDVEAVFNRLIYFPFQNPPISDSQDNKHLSDELYEEKDLIFTWAMKGLRDYIANNETFPTAKLSDEIKRINMARFCPEKMFFEECIKLSDGYYESSSAIKASFAQFCVDNNVAGKPDIVRFLEEHQRIPKTKKRIDADGKQIGAGNPIHVYEGIRLRKKYRKEN